MGRPWEEPTHIRLSYCTEAMSSAEPVSLSLTHWVCPALVAAGASGTLIPKPIESDSAIECLCVQQQSKIGNPYNYWYTLDEIEYEWFRA